MNNEKVLKNVLTVLAILLMSILVGLVIYNLWHESVSSGSVYHEYKEETDSDVNIDLVTLERAKSLYQTAYELYLANDQDKVFEVDANNQYIPVTQEKNYVENKKNDTTDYYQIKNSIINDNFSKNGIDYILKNWGNIIKVGSHYYAKAGFTYVDAMDEPQFNPIKITTNQITFEVTNHINGVENKTNFVIEKESNVWKIKNYVQPKNAN